MNLKVIIIASSVVSALALQGMEISITPGEMAAKIESVGSATELKVMGQGDIRDLMAIGEHLKSVKALDLSNLEIKEYSSPNIIWENRSYFAANELPVYIFFQSSFNSVVLPETLVSIADGAFAGAMVSTVLLPEGLRTIGSHAFYDCRQLCKIDFPESLISIGDWAFARCESLKSVSLSNTNISELPERVFINCTDLTDITLPRSCNKLGKEVFSGTAISDLDVSRITTADDYALVGMSHLQSVNLSTNAQFGDGLLMANESLKSISGMPLDVPRLFAANCKNLTLDTQLQRLQSAGDYSFANTQANKIILGQYLQKVDRGAFSGLSGLNEIDATRLGDKVPEAATDSFADIEQPNVNLVVADGTEEAWKAAQGWNQFNILSDKMVRIDSVPSDCGFEILMCDGVLKVVAPEPISAVEIYSTDGRLLFSVMPGMSLWQGRIQIPEKILLVRVQCPTHSRTAKIGNGI